MSNAINWLIGTIIALIQIKTVLTCDITNTTDGKLYADCTNQSLRRVPSYLGEKLQILNISNNPIRILSNEHSKIYPDLVELIMNSLIRSGELTIFFTNFLLPLQKLEILDISGTYLTIPPLILPKSLRKLVANRMLRVFAFFDLSELNNLTHLEMNNSSLHALPISLSPEAPLVELHINDNYMDKLRYTDLAPYCLLEQLYLTTSTLTTDTFYYNHCCDIVIWLHEKDVANTVECQKNSIAEPCDLEAFRPDSRALAAYDQCLIRHGRLKTSTFWKIFIIFVSFMAIILLPYGLYKLYGFYKARKAARNSKHLEEEEKSR